MGFLRAWCAPEGSGRLSWLFEIGVSSNLTNLPKLTTPPNATCSDFLISSTKKIIFPPKQAGGYICPFSHIFFSNAGICYFIFPVCYFRTAKTMGKVVLPLSWFDSFGFESRACDFWHIMNIYKLIKLTSNPLCWRALLHKDWSWKTENQKLFTSIALNVGATYNDTTAWWNYWECRDWHLVLRREPRLSAGIKTRRITGGSCQFLW